MLIDEMRAIVAQCSFQDYEIGVCQSRTGAIYLQAGYDEADTATGITERQLTRRWFLSPEMTKCEIVSTAFKCILTSMEHRAREWFLYRGRAIYQPHYDVDVLHSVCEERDIRIALETAVQKKGLSSSVIRETLKECFAK